MFQSPFGVPLLPDGSLPEDGIDSPRSDFDPSAALESINFEDTAAAAGGVNLPNPLPAGWTLKEGDIQVFTASPDSDKFDPDEFVLFERASDLARTQERIPIPIPFIKRILLKRVNELVINPRTNEYEETGEIPIILFLDFESNHLNEDDSKPEDALQKARSLDKALKEHLPWLVYFQCLDNPYHSSWGIGEQSHLQFKVGNMRFYFSGEFFNKLQEFKIFSEEEKDYLSEICGYKDTPEEDAKVWQSIQAAKKIGDLNAVFTLVRSMHQESINESKNKHRVVRVPPGKFMYLDEAYTAYYWADVFLREGKNAIAAKLYELTIIPNAMSFYSRKQIHSMIAHLKLDPVIDPLTGQIQPIDPDVLNHLGRAQSAALYTDYLAAYAGFGYGERPFADLGLLDLESYEAALKIQERLARELRKEKAKNLKASQMLADFGGRLALDGKELAELHALGITPPNLSPASSGSSVMNSQAYTPFSGSTASFSETAYPSTRHPMSISQPSPSAWNALQPYSRSVVNMTGSYPGLNSWDATAANPAYPPIQMSASMTPMYTGSKQKFQSGPGTPSRKGPLVVSDSAYATPAHRRGRTESMSMHSTLRADAPPFTPSGLPSPAASPVALLDGSFSDSVSSLGGSFQATPERDGAGPQRELVPGNLGRAKSEASPRARGARMFMPRKLVFDDD